MKTGKTTKRKEWTILINKLRNSRKKTRKYSKIIKLEMMLIGNKNKN